MSSSASTTLPRLGVLFVHTATRPPLGADTWVHAQIIGALDQSTHELHAACATGTEPPFTPTFEALRAIPGLRVIPVDFGPEVYDRSRSGRIRGYLVAARAVGSLARLAVYIRRKRIALIHTSDRPRDASACVLLARLTRTKCIVHSHVKYGTWMSRPLRWSLMHADARIAVSEFVARSLIETGHNRNGTHVVLNAIDLERWKPGIGRAETRLELGLPADAPVVVTVCRLMPSKGSAELIRALALVRQTLPDVRLVIVGHDLSVDGSFARELRRLAEECDMADNVVFTGRRDDVPRLMAAADVFALPSVEEPFGLVYLEAMAMKLPVVALDNGGTPEVVEHGRSGLLSELGDTGTLASHLLSLLNDPALRGTMGEYGRQQVEQRFTTGRMARDTAEVYRLVTCDGVDGTQ